MKEFIVAMIITAIVLVVIFGPLAFIWSLNTLFPTLFIPYTFKTWVSALFLTGLFAVRVSSSSK